MATGTFHDLLALGHGIENANTSCSRKVEVGIVPDSYVPNVGDHPGVAVDKTTLENTIKASHFNDEIC